jgi:feruloyl esterase
MYHGFADPLITPLASLEYYGKLVDFFGSRNRGRGDDLEEVQEFARLFMIPGMGHCNGGPGTDTFDGIAALQDWVEHRKPPKRILASHLTAGVVDKTRPLCAWPQTAVYTGSGSTNDAANFVCRGGSDDDHDGDDRGRGRERD